MLDSLTRCFLLSVVCNRFTGRNKVVFCIFGMAQGNPRVRVFHSFLCLPGRVAVRPQVASWAAFCGLDKFTSAIPSRPPHWVTFYVWSRPSVELSLTPRYPCSRVGALCIGKQSGYPGQLASFLRGRTYLACTGNHLKTFLTCSDPGRVSGPGVLYF